MRFRLPSLDFCMMQLTDPCPAYRCFQCLLILLPQLFSRLAHLRCFRSRICLVGPSLLRCLSLSNSSEHPTSGHATFNAVMSMLTIMPGCLGMLTRCEQRTRATSMAAILAVASQVLETALLYTPRTQLELTAGVVDVATLTSVRARCSLRRLVSGERAVAFVA